MLRIGRLVDFNTGAGPMGGICGALFAESSCTRLFGFQSAAVAP